MTKAEARQLQELSDALEAVHAELGDILSTHETSWTLNDLRRELDRWKRELQSTTGSEGQPYSPDTIRTHIGHSAQFIRWFAGEWRSQGPRSRS